MTLPSCSLLVKGKLDTAHSTRSCTLAKLGSCPTHFSWQLRICGALVTSIQLLGPLFYFSTMQLPEQCDKTFPLLSILLWFIFITWALLCCLSVSSFNAPPFFLLVLSSNLHSLSSCLCVQTTLIWLSVLFSAARSTFSYEPCSWPVPSFTSFYWVKGSPLSATLSAFTVGNTSSSVSS